MTLEKINKEIDLIISSGVFGKNFKFRNGQREVIIDICMAFYKNQNDDGPDSIILDSPVGSGKSIIALFTSTILSHFKKTGYILTPNLSLQDQYESDLERLKINAAMVKGSDNYLCTVNNKTFSYGECSVRNISPKKMQCSSTCPYIIKREIAAESSIAVLSYAYWLLQRNYVAKKAPEHLFVKRDFTFFDESHNINDIVQSLFSPAVPKNIYDTVGSVQKFLIRTKFIDHNIINLPILLKITQRLFENTSNKDTYVLLTEFNAMMSRLITYSEKIKKTIKIKYPQSKHTNSTETIPISWTSALKHLDIITEIYDKLHDYIIVTKERGVENIVKRIREDEIILNFIEESYLVKKHLINESRFKIYMSATIGDPLEYMKNCGIDSAKYIKTDNTFNFEKSPILFLKGFSLNHNNKSEIVPKLTKYIDILLSTIEKNNRGIIHTGSYENTELILNNSIHRNRIITYRGSSEKKDALREFEMRENSILMGPSLLEGLDLRDELSRFQIFLKVPYASLGDPLVKAKLNRNQKWYKYDATIKILQGIGRSIRSEADFARTYLLDGNFNRILKSQNLPKHITERYGDLNEILKKILENGTKKN